MIRFCPNCQQRYVVSFETIDYEHICNSGNKALDEEDVIIVGDWEDYTGTGKRPAQAVLMAGAHNELQGTRAEIEGEDKEGLTRRGQRSSTTRQRQHLHFIKLKNRGLC